MNTANNDSLNGRRVRFGVGQPDRPESEREPDVNHGGSVVVENGDIGTIVMGFDDWNGVTGLTIFYVQFDRGTATHLSAREFELMPAASADDGNGDNPFSVGDRIVTTVHSIGGRSAEVVGTITEVVMSRRSPDRVAAYITSTESHGRLSVEAAKARKAP